MKTKIYIPVSILDELPKKEGRYPVVIAYENREGYEYFTQAEYSKEYSFHEEMMDCSLITHWLKEVELTLPSDEEIHTEFKEYHFRHKSNFTSRGEYFTHAAKWLREQITKQLKIK